MLADPRARWRVWWYAVIGTVLAVIVGIATGAFWFLGSLAAGLVYAAAVTFLEVRIARRRGNS